MNPFAELVNYSSIQARRRSVGDTTSRAGFIRKHMADGPKSAADLAALTNQTAKEVLKHLEHDIRSGRVRYVEGDLLDLVDDTEEDIRMATALLRRNGFTVTRNKPRASK